MDGQGGVARLVGLIVLVTAGVAGGQFDVRPGPLELGPIANAGFESPAIAGPAAAGADGWGVAATTQNVPNTDAAHGTAMFSPGALFTGDQVGRLDAADNTFAQTITHPDDSNVLLFASDLDLVWSVDLSIGRRGTANDPAQTNPAVLDVFLESFQFTVVQHKQAAFDTNDLEAGAWTRRTLVLDATGQPTTGFGILSWPIRLRLTQSDDPGHPGGQVFVDDVALYATEPGDFGRDGDFDADDIDLIGAELGKPPGERSALFDLDGDGSVDFVDRTAWVRDLMGTEFGDTNLDRLVDILDLDALGANWGKAGGWAKADFNGDGLIDVLDLGALGTHWGFDNTAAPPTPVPEPGGAGVLLLALSAAARRRVRRGRG